MVFITVSFVITFRLNSRPYLAVCFTVATKRQTPACIWDCHFVSTPEYTWEGQYHAQHMECLSSWAVAVWLKAHSAMEVLSVGGASPLGRTPRIYKGLQMPDRPYNTNSPACNSVLASDAGSNVSLHWALITKWKDTPACRNTAISAEPQTTDLILLINVLRKLRISWSTISKNDSKKKPLYKITVPRQVKYTKS
jgi:hypothetical protein